jgi:hypothetical protein
VLPGWIDEVESEVRACLCGCAWISPSEIARRLRISEGAALSYICLLAAEGRLRIEAVSLPGMRRVTSGASTARRDDRAVKSSDATWLRQPPADTMSDSSDGPVGPRLEASADAGERDCTVKIV